MDGAEAQFDGDRADVRASRAFVVETVTELGLSDLADTAALLTSEVVTNAVLHARSRVTVRVVLADRLLRIEVEDASAARPVRKRYRDDSATGRGIMLVETLGVGWGVDELDQGKRVWFTLDPERPAAERTEASGETSPDVGGEEPIDLDALASALGETDSRSEAPGMVFAR